MGANPYYEKQIIENWGPSIQDATFFKSGLNTNQRVFMNQGLQGSSKGRTPPPIGRGKRRRTFKFSPIGKFSPIRTNKSRKARPKSRAKSPKQQKKTKFGRKNQITYDYTPFNQMKDERERKAREAINEAARIMSMGRARRTLRDDDNINDAAYYLSVKGREEQERDLNVNLGLSPNTGRPRLGRLAPSPRRIKQAAISKVKGNRKYAGGKKSKKRRSRKRRTKQTRKRRRRRRN